MQLIIAEKHSVGETIAKVLGIKGKKDGYIEGGDYIITWCVGHLVNLSLPEKYGEQYADFWTTDSLPIIPHNWIFEVVHGKVSQFNVVKKLMNDNRVNDIVCATDAGREGECIFRYVYNYIGCKKPVKRLWISSMEHTAISQGMANLQPYSSFDNLFAAGLARSKADWLVGMNGTRLFSNRYKAVLTIGRVQTPVLAMIVQRDYDIEHFVKQKYFTVGISCNGFIACSERIDDEYTANTICSECDGKNAVVSEVKKEIKTANPPKLYDLTTLQREANRQYGFTAKQTLEYTQSLYEAKLVTYPRTDSQYLTEDMEHTAIDMIEIIRNYIPEYGNVPLANPDIKHCLNNAKVSDHTAIIPTAEIANKDINGLSSGEKKILLLIAAKLLTAAAEPHKYESVKVTVTCENHVFHANGKTVIEDGFKAVEKYIKSQLKGNDIEKAESETKLPEISEGQIFENVPASIDEHWTTPPKPYTEDTLLKAMETAGNADYDENAEVEKKGLGTPATRADIIEHLVERQYIVRDKKKITAAEKGVKLISVLPDEVKSPKLTADWETALQNIEKGKYSTDRFMSDIESFVRNLVNNYSDQVENSEFSNGKEPIGVCPRCGKNVFEGKMNYYCESGKDGCNFTIWKDQKNLQTEITRSAAVELLANKVTRLTAVSKQGNKYTANFKLVDTGKYINLEFVPDSGIGKCPKCGADIANGDIYYCKGKCGMNVGKVYGKILTEVQLKNLLAGKLISFTSNGNKTIVLPEVVENNYQGKTYYQWQTKKG